MKSFSLNKKEKKNDHHGLLYLQVIVWATKEKRRETKVWGKDGEEKKKKNSSRFLFNAALLAKE